MEQEDLLERVSTLCRHVERLNTELKEAHAKNKALEAQIVENTPATPEPSTTSERLDAL